MHIAYVTETYPPELNGVALTVQRTVSFLERRGHGVELIRPRQPGEAACEEVLEWRTPGVPIPVYRDLRMGMPMLGKLRQRWRKNRPQVVHVATPGPLGWAAVRVARSLGIAVTADFRTNFHQYSRYYGMAWLEPVAGAFLRNLHNAADRSFVPTRALRGQLQRDGFQRLEVSGRGVDTQLFDPARRSDALRAEWGADADTPVLIYVGRLAAEKNVGLALAAFDACKQARPEVRMVVVGDGPQRAKLQAAHPDVIFAGVQRDEALARYYASADLFLFPSMTDTFGNVVLEAMASGLAVLAYDTAAPAEHIEHGISGMLVPPDDADDYRMTAWAIAGQSNAWLHRIGDEARKVALRAEWNRILAGFEHHLYDAVQTRFVSNGQPCPV